MVAQANGHPNGNGNGHGNGNSTQFGPGNQAAKGRKSRLSRKDLDGLGRGDLLRLMIRRRDELALGLVDRGNVRCLELALADYSGILVDSAADPTTDVTGAVTQLLAALRGEDGEDAPDAA